MPEKPTSSWERGAKLVKDTDVTNPYLEHIRKDHDPALHLKTIEDELRGTMGKALGKQGEKITRALASMKQEYDLHEQLLCSKNDDAVAEQQACAKRHNEFRQVAIKARWELLVHRQAVGFVVNNHKFVHEQFPIPPALPETSSLETNETNKENTNTSSVAENATTKEFGDQLDWWQRIGRWR